MYCVTAGKDYPIQASTRDEMLVWVKAIEDAKVWSQYLVNYSTSIPDANGTEENGHFS